MYDTTIPLWMLKPRVILAQGMMSADVVKPMCAGNLPHRVVAQKIARYGTTAQYKARDGRVIAEPSEAIESSG